MFPGELSTTIRIALIDDSPTDIEIGQRYVKSYFESREDARDMEISISTYLDGPSFLSEFEEGKFDLIFLDIYMPGMDGIEAAKNIRQKDEDVKILFLTTSREHALESYQVFALGYILKPLISHKDDLFSALNRALPPGALKPAALILRIPGNETLKFPLSRIMYIDCNKSRTATIHMKDKEAPTREMFQEVAETLSDDRRFFECYHKVLLNMDFIESMDDESFRLTDGTVIPISRRKKKEVKNHYMQYLLSK